MSVCVCACVRACVCAWLYLTWMVNNVCVCLCACYLQACISLLIILPFCPPSSRIQGNHRTCSIWLGVGDRNEQTFRLIEYSSSTANVFDDKNISMIEESRFNREHCNDTCYHNYAMTGEDLVMDSIYPSEFGCMQKFHCPIYRFGILGSSSRLLE